MRRAPVIYREALRAHGEARAIIEAAEAEADEIRASASRAQAAAEAERAEARAALERRLADVVVAAVEAILEAELRSRPELVVCFVGRALELAADPAARVRLHPDDVRHHPGSEPDRTVSPGSCVVETEGARIQCSPRTQAEGLRELWVDR